VRKKIDKEKIEREDKGGKTCCEPETSSYRCCRTDRPSCPVFFCLFFCTNCLCFLLHRGAQTRAKPRARTKQGRSWLVTRETWSTAAVAWFPFFVLCSNARRTQSCVTGVSAGNRDRKRRRKKEKKFMVKELEKTHRDQQRTTKLARQFNPNTYRMKVRG
jgi:hypothetical protein